MNRKGHIVWLVAALSAAAAACDDGEVTPPAPVPGDLAVTLASPNGMEGAAVFETTDVGIFAVTAATGVDAFYFRAGGRSRIVVLLEAPGTIRFALGVEDVNNPPQLELVEVADPSNGLRTDLAGYQLEMVPIESENGA